MPIFKYIARSRTGERVQGSIEANDRRSALIQIERQGHVPVSVSEGGASAALPAAGEKKKRFRLERRKGGRARMKAREVVLFTRELSDLLASGMTLGNALHTLSQRKIARGQDRIVMQLRDDVVQGSSLSDALAKWPDTFPELYVSLVRAGEVSGQMVEVLERLCRHTEMVQDAREKVTMALVYPGIVLSMGLATMVFTMVFVVPRFSQVFAELHTTLPLPTRILIGLSTFILRYGWLLLGGIIATAILFRRAIRTPKGRKWWDGVLLRMPVVKAVIRAHAFAQFARTLESLLANGVPVLQALSIVQDTVGNHVIAEEIREARERVTDGSTISGPLAQGKVFPRLLTDMLAVGEQSGNVSGALGHIGKRYEAELDRSVKLFTTVLEPVLILLMAIMVGFVAVSMLLAIFDLTSGLNA
jgi:type IV pilus assembly protein PilC